MQSSAKHLKLVVIPLLVFVFANSFLGIYSIQENSFFDSNHESITDQKVIAANIELEINDILESNTWGSPLRVTSPDIERDGIGLAQDYSGIYHCVWVREFSSNEFSLSYSSTKNDSSIEWINETHILQTQAKITKLNVIFDENNTLHLSYIAVKQELYRIYYLTKEENNDTWSTEQILYFDNKLKLTNLESAITNNKTIHYFWIATEKSFDENYNKSSTIHYYSFTGTANTDDPLIQDLFNSTNPEQVSITVKADESLHLIWTNESSIGIDQSNIFLATSNNTGETWIEKISLSFGTKLQKLVVSSSQITNNSFIIGMTEKKPYELYFLEYYSNNTLSDTPILITENERDGYLGGFVENKTNGNLFIIFEEKLNARSDLFLRERNNSTNLWGDSIKITDDMYSTNPIFVRNSFSENDIGVLNYLGKNELISQKFLLNGNWTTTTNVFHTMKYNSRPSFVIDSEGTAHLVWTHSGVDTHQIYYMTKEFEKPWIFKESLSVNWWKTATSPSLVMDSNENLFCFFVAEDNNTKDDGMYYRYLLNGQNNWSFPELIKIPGGNAYQIQPEVIIDSLNTIHIIWVERITIFSNNIVYSSKKTIDVNFTSINIQENDDFYFSVDFDMIIDSTNKIHLVYSDINENENPRVFKIQYRYLPSGGIWSEIETIDATNTGILIEPMLVIDSNEKISLAYLRRYYIVLQKWATDIRAWEKSSPSANWEQKEPIITYEIIDHHNFFILPDDTICQIFHSNYFSPDGNPSYIKDYVQLMQKPAEEEWGERELLFLNPLYDYKPLAQFDPHTKQLQIIIGDKRGLQPQLNWLMKQNDTDGDNFGDLDEQIYRTNSAMTDSDLDGLSDGYEMKTSFTNPFLNDTDWDGLSDGDEINIYFCDPLDIDSDRDYLSDGEEILIWMTNPNFIDTDLDGIYDFDETHIYYTDPNSEDTDSDLMPDLWEIINGLDPLVNDRFGDVDSDFLSNLDEYLYHSDPNNMDTDGDGLIDGREVHTYKTSPIAFDTDQDTLSDSDEILLYGTDPLSEDSDSDGFTDREEINIGTDPNDPRDNIRLERLNQILLVTLIPTGIALSMAIYLEIRYRYRVKRAKSDEELILLENQIIPEELLQNENDN